MTENHGVPGSNPGPATYKSPANSGKRKSPAALPEPRVNSPFEKTPPLARLWYPLAYQSVVWMLMARVILLSYANRSLRLYGPPRLLHVQARGRHRKAGSDAMASTLDSSPSRKLEGPH